MLIEAVSMDDSERLVAEVSQAWASSTPLTIRGGNSKAFLGRPLHGTPIDTRSHRGVVSYDPTELVITARAGTPVSELNATLDAAGQMLPCEPPSFDGTATVGGMVAAGLAGPRRPWSGSVRDFVLGCRVITGNAKHLRFGGEVMKNVAGYDVSRLLAGSFGCLGLITEVSLKVLPKPRALSSLALDLDAHEALRELSAWRRAALPVSGAAYVDGRLHVRLEGGVGSVAAAVDRIGASELDPRFWDELVGEAPLGGQRLARLQHAVHDQSFDTLGDHVRHLARAFPIRCLDCRCFHCLFNWYDHFKMLSRVSRDIPCNPFVGRNTV